MLHNATAFKVNCYVFEANDFLGAIKLTQFFIS